MFRKIAISAVSALTLTIGAITADAAFAASEAHINDVDFSFEGPFGTFDRNQLQRGLQVFTDVCAGCHGMKFVPIRSLTDEGGPELPADQVRAYAAGLDAVTLPDGEERPREWTDKFPARSGEGMGPDLSLMAKARAGFQGPYGTGISQMVNGIGGPEYIASILAGYEDAPACAPADFPGYYNTAFANGGYPDACKNEEGHQTVPGSWIAMPPPLADDLVTYADGQPATVDNMAEDTASFLMWTAEPKMMARKSTGFVAVLFLGLLTVLLYLTNKRIWASVKGKKKPA